MKKTRFIALILLILLTLGSFCSCDKEDSEVNKETEVNKDNESSNEVLPEIVEAYALDKEGKALIAGLFKDFDNAFAALSKKDSIGDADFQEYAEAVVDAFDVFDDTFRESYYNALGDKLDTDEQQLIYIRYPSSLSLTMDRLKILTGDMSGESFAEDAINFVNEVSTYFYGMDWITDDDLDALA